MSKIAVFTSLLLIASAGAAAAQKRDAGDRALGTELNRDRAETRIERLRQDQRQKDERPTPAPRAQKLPAGNSTQQPSR